jgi:hypothetical protein
MGTAYKAAIPGATVTVSPEGSCRGRAAAPGSSPRRHAPPCAWQCWRSSPIRPSAPGAEHHARWRAGLKSAPAVATLPALPQNHGSRAGSSTHILPAEYAPVTHRNAGVAGGAQINQSGPSPSGSDISRHPRRRLSEAIAESFLVDGHFCGEDMSPPQAAGRGNGRRHRGPPGAYPAWCAR